MTDNIIIVYDKLETDFTHYGLAVITTTLDPGPRIFERMNADYTCEFTVPYTDPAVNYLVEENIVKVDGQLFIIRTPIDIRDANGRLCKDIFAEHISTELLTEYIPLLQYTNTTASVIVNGLFAGTRFTGDATAITTNHDFLVERNMVSWGINHFLILANCEMKRDNFNVIFKPQIGADNGVRISYRKNLKSIKRTKESRGIITRLFVYGKDDFALPEPIDSPNIGLYPRPKCGSVTFDEVEDLVTLLENGEAYLATVDTPALAYEAEVIELKNAEGWDESEGFELGDTVHIDEEDLGIIVTARIIEYERFPFMLDRSRVTLANFLPSLVDTVTQLQESNRVIEKVTTSGGRINSSWIEGKINTLKNQLVASGAYASSDVLENQGFLLENTDINSPDYGALYLGPGIFAIASEKVGGDWSWRTFGKGSGFTADLINAGTIQASLIRIDANTTFDPGYDPSTKETPEGAQAKANAAIAAAVAAAEELATEAAEEASQAAAALAEERAKAYADGIVTEEEQARIAQAEDTLAAAQADADAKAAAAKQAAIQAAALDATAKADAARIAAEQTAASAAQAARDLAEENAKAYADGIVTEEEQARIAQAEGTLATAKADAAAKAAAAEQAAKDAAVLKGIKYKSVYMDANGFHIDGPNGEVMRMGEFADGQFGTIAYHADGSTTALTPAGLIRKTAMGDKPYNYLTAAGNSSTGTTGAYFITSSTGDNGAGIPDVTITLPSDFKGKDFKVFLALKQDSFYAQELKQNPGTGLRVINYAPEKTQIEVVSRDVANGTFRVKGYGSLYRWNVSYTVSGTTVVPTYNNLTKHDYALEFAWIAIV